MTSARQSLLTFLELVFFLLQSQTFLKAFLRVSTALFKRLHWGSLLTKNLKPCHWRYSAFFLIWVRQKIFISQVNNLYQWFPKWFNDIKDFLNKFHLKVLLTGFPFCLNCYKVWLDNHYFKRFIGRVKSYRTPLYGSHVLDIAITCLGIQIFHFSFHSKLKLCPETFDSPCTKVEHKYWGGCQADAGDKEMSTACNTLQIRYDFQNSAVCTHRYIFSN